MVTVDVWSWAAIFELRQRLRQSLWVIPLLGTVVGVGAAQLDLLLEGRISMPTTWAYSASTASALLSAVAAAMVGLVGLVVTIGVLVVQMATGTLSPRFMRLWYRDRLQKLVLASFTATFAFAYILLSEVGSGPVPDLGVSVAGMAVTVDLILLLLYLNRFVHALRPVAVAAAMARSGLAVVSAAVHEVASSSIARAHGIAPGSPDMGDRASLQVRATRGGAILAIHSRGIVRLAARRDLVCNLRHTVGDFVMTGTVVADLYGAASSRDARRLRTTLALGEERTIDQDPAFAIRVMVDIAIRALSPAVNDPTTATQVINHIGALLFGIGGRETGEHGEYRDSHGEVRLTLPTRSWRDYLELGVAEIRQYGATSPQVCRRLRALLVDLETSVPPANRAAVAEQLVRLDRAVATSFHDTEDRRFASLEDSQGIGGPSEDRRTHVGARS